MSCPFLDQSFSPILIHYSFGHASLSLKQISSSLEYYSMEVDLRKRERMSRRQEENKNSLRKGVIIIWASVRSLEE